MAAKSGRFACLTFEGEGRDLYQNVFPWLEKQCIPATLIVAVNEVCQKFEASNRLGVTTPTRMTWKNLKHLVGKGWQVGTSGLSAVNLTELSYKEQRFQIGESRRILGDRLGQAPDIFAYPGGAYCATSTKCVREEGFRWALTRNRASNSTSTARYHLGRLTLSGHLLKDIWTIARTLAKPPRGPRIAALRDDRKSRRVGAEAPVATPAVIPALTPALGMPLPSPVARQTEGIKAGAHP